MFGFSAFADTPFASLPSAGQSYSVDLTESATALRAGREALKMELESSRAERRAERLAVEALKIEDEAVKALES